MDHERDLRIMYRAFDARDIELALSLMTDDVDWPNAWEGGRAHGHQEIRDYWTRQWQAMNTTVEPIAFSTRPDGRVAVDVLQEARDLAGGLIGQGQVIHVYEFRDRLVTRMDVE